MKNLKAIKKLIIRVLTPIKPLVVELARVIAWIGEKPAYYSNKFLFMAQWFLPPEPKWFDNNINLYYKWLQTKNPFWLERGAYSIIAIKPGAEILEVACGDGFNTKNFYSHASKRVVALDIDEDALNLAKKRNSAPNIEYVLMDVTKSIPEGKFDNVIFDSVIQQLNPEDIHSVMKNLKPHLKAGGIVSGNTQVIEKTKGGTGFSKKQDVMKFFSPYFKNVLIFETINPGRHNFYFYASDGVIPFSKNWPNSITK